MSSTIGGIHMPDVPQDLEDALKDPLAIRTPADQSNPLATMSDVAAKFEIFQTEYEAPSPGLFTKTISHNLALTNINPASGYPFTHNFGGFGNPVRNAYFAFTCDQGLVSISAQVIGITLDDFNYNNFYGAMDGTDPGAPGLASNDITFCVARQSTSEGGVRWLLQMTLMRGSHTAVYIP
jgi:hypothetical protein